MKKWALWIAAGITLAGCHNDMWFQPKVKAESESDFYSDGRGSRDPVSGTVQFGQANLDEAFNTGYVNGRLVEEMPVPLTRDLILRGQERFNIFCRHCHGAVGDGQGMIAKRGLEVERPVATYHTDRLREMPIGHFFNVITNGYGVMLGFESRIPAEDRWAIAAYLRVLQLSQHASYDDVPEEKRGELGSARTMSVPPAYGSRSFSGGAGDLRQPTGMSPGSETQNGNAEDVASQDESGGEN